MTQRLRCRNFKSILPTMESMSPASKRFAPAWKMYLYLSLPHAMLQRSKRHELHSTTCGSQEGDCADLARSSKLDDCRRHAGDLGHAVRLRRESRPQGTPCLCA